MAQPSIKGAKQSETQHAPRPEANAPENGNPNRPDGKQRGRVAKPAYPGLVAGQLLTAVPTDWIQGTHAKLKKENFANADLFKAYVQHYDLGKKPHPALCDESGKKAKQISAWPADVKIGFHCEGIYQELESKDFSTPAQYYRSLVGAIQAALIPLTAKADRLEKMTPADIEREEEREKLLKQMQARDAKLLALFDGDAEAVKQFKLSAGM